MSGEPHLSKGQSSEWVLYLQQLLAHRGYWPYAADGSFGDDLEEVVRQWQHASGLEPSGRVDEATWASLTQEDSTAAHDGLSGHPQEVPASFSVAGAPSFRYKLPGITLAEATVDTGAAIVKVELELTGEVTVSFPHGAAGMSVDQEGWRVAASNSLAGVTQDVYVDKLGSGNPTITSEWGNQYYSTSCEFEPPNTAKFSGAAKIDYAVPTEAGDAHVTGEPGFELSLSVFPKLEAQAEAIRDTETFYERNADALAAAGVGALLLIGLALFLAPETGGGSLIFVPALL
jgi:hypothetical protein